MNLTEREEKLKPLLTDEFLSTLYEAARVSGWSLDYVATWDFVEQCFLLAGRSPPAEKEPYDIT